MLAMSISTMTRLVHARQVQEETTRAKTSFDEIGQPIGARHIKQEEIEQETTTALDKLTGFVPTEVITGYAAAVGLLIPTESLHRWLIFLAAVLVLIVLILLDFALREKRVRESTATGEQVSQLTSRRRIIFSVVIASLAFTVWAFAVPTGSPALDWGEGATRVFAVVAIAVSAVLYRVAQLVDIAPGTTST
jgi:hypothetical protein